MHAEAPLAQAAFAKLPRTLMQASWRFCGTALCMHAYLEVTVDDLALVQVVHATRHLHRQLQHVRQLQRPLLRTRA